MSKNYKEINILVGDIQKAVNVLLEYKQKNELVFINFNGHKLYSDTVTLDSAYLEITGKTKAEIDKEHENWLKEYNRQEQEHKDNIPILTAYWIERAKGIILDEKLSYWNEIVPIRLNDLYHGMELGNTLDIITALKDNDLEKAKILFNEQGHSGMSAGLVVSMIETFYDTDKIFRKYINY